MAAGGLQALLPFLERAAAVVWRIFVPLHNPVLCQAHVASVFTQAWVAAGGLGALLPFLERAAARSRQRLAAGDPKVTDPGITGMDAVIDAFDTAGGTLLVQHSLLAPSHMPSTNLACDAIPKLWLQTAAICSLAPVVQMCRHSRSAKSWLLVVREVLFFCCRGRSLSRRCRSRLISCASHLLRPHAVL